MNLPSKHYNRPNSLPVMFWRGGDPTAGRSRFPTADLSCLEVRTLKYKWTAAQTKQKSKQDKAESGLNCESKQYRPATTIWRHWGWQDTGVKHRGDGDHNLNCQGGWSGIRAQQRAKNVAWQHHNSFIISTSISTWGFTLVLSVIIKVVSVDVRGPWTPDSSPAIESTAYALKKHFWLITCTFMQRFPNYTQSLLCEKIICFYLKIFKRNLIKVEELNQLIYLIKSEKADRFWQLWVWKCRVFIDYVKLSNTNTWPSLDCSTNSATSLYKAIIGNKFFVLLVYVSITNYWRFLTLFFCSLCFVSASWIDSSLK